MGPRREDLERVVSVQPVAMVGGGFGFRFRPEREDLAPLPFCFEPVGGRYTVPIDGQYSVAVGCKPLLPAEQGFFLALALVESLEGTKSYTHIGPRRDAQAGCDGRGGEVSEKKLEELEPGPGGRGIPTANLSIKGGYASQTTMAGFEGSLLHLRRGDVLYVRAAAASEADNAGLADALKRVIVTFQVELVMRKRKRRPQSVDINWPTRSSLTKAGVWTDTESRAAEEYSQAPETSNERNAGGAHPPDSRHTQKRAKCVPRGRGASSSDVRMSLNTGDISDDHIRSGMACTVEDQDKNEAGERSVTGSDTEWSEGFSSDDDTRRAARPPRSVRQLMRQTRTLARHHDGDEEDDDDTARYACD